MAGHAYGEGVIRLFLQLVLDAACSLRGASVALKLLMGLLPGVQRTPVANAGQFWLLRIGLYELTRPKETADDWVWIVDHTVQIGVVKCLAIVGCRLSVWQAAQRPLEHRDLQVLTLQPVDRSDGEIVYQQLEQTARTTGSVPRAVLSDEGTDLKRGIQAFCAQHPETVASLDVAHQAAKLLKRELDADPRWQGFVGAAGGVRQRLAQTPWAHLLPPTQRDKARYMNLAPLVAWAGNVLAYLDRCRAEAPAEADAVQAKLGWLTDYRQGLVEWAEWMALIEATLHYVRHQGYHRGAVRALRPRLALLTTTDTARRFAEKLLCFVRSQSAQARPGERLLGSSEVLESLLGKGKRLEGQQSKSGFTKMLLGVAAAVVEPTQAYLTQALTSVKTCDVLAWCRQHLGPSVQSKRRHAFATGTNPG